MSNVVGVDDLHENVQDVTFKRKAMVEYELAPTLPLTQTPPLPHQPYPLNYS